MANLLLEQQFGQLLMDCEEPKASRRSKLWRRWVRIGPRDERPITVLRRRIIRHFYLTGMGVAAIAKQTGLSESYCQHAVQGLSRDGVDQDEMEAVEARVETIQREFTADGVAGVFLKMDRIGSLAFKELERRLTDPEEVALMENRDLVSLLGNTFKQFTLFVDRIRTSDPSTSAKFLNTEEAKRQIEENADILDKIEAPPGLKVVSKE